MIAFQEFRKIARLSRNVVVTEKIDGTNAQVAIMKADGIDTFDAAQTAVAANRELGLLMLAGSRTQWVTPVRDNYGWAQWVRAHSDELWALGEGSHFGEWWGSGIQRGYGLPKGEKRFSLFNTNRWGVTRDVVKYPTDAPVCCHVVPVLRSGVFSEADISDSLTMLERDGSVASPGFAKPEGVVIYHTHANVYFKKTLERDDAGKSFAA